MAVVVMLMLMQSKRGLRRSRIIRDRTNPLDTFDDVEMYSKFRFRRHDILSMVDEIKDELEMANRGYTVLPCIQVCVALRFYATGSFQSACADLAGISQPTASRIIKRVTRALLKHVQQWIIFPDQKEADRQKSKFYNIGGFPNVVGCLDATHIRIQAPRNNEHEYLNRKNYHSLNVQFICNADMLFIDVVAKWPGSVHDARILRQSRFFSAFEASPRPVDGTMLADSAYMMREWLMTPYENPATLEQWRYNVAHSSTRRPATKAIRFAKKRWHCLRGLRLEPEKACQVTVVCLMLSNRARFLNLPDPDDDAEDQNDEHDDQDEDELKYDLLQDKVATQDLSNERTKVEEGETARNSVAYRFFWGL